MRDVARSKAERGAALLVVTVVLIIILAAGLAGVALTSGELAGAAGVRVRATTDNCADAAVERLLAMLPNKPTFDETERTMSVGGSNFTMRAGHLAGSDGTDTVVELDPSSFDMGALYKGLNITNTMGTVMGGNLAEGLRILKLTARCDGGTTYGKREAQIILRYGTPTN